MIKNQSIAIFTLWWSRDNYGQLLQMYALQTILKDLGYDPYIVKYYPPSKRKVIDKIKLLYRVFNLKKVSNYLKDKFESSKYDRGFGFFKENHINFSDQEYRSLIELQDYPPIADYYFCGSDQVWNRKNDDDLRVYLLDFGNSKKIAYAASFGMKYVDIPNNYKKIFQTYIHNFTDISVREESGINACEKFSFPNAKWVPDPTLLLYRQFYERKFNNNVVLPKNWLNNHQNILIYTVGNKSIKNKNVIIKRLKNKFKNNVIHISSQQDFSGNVYPSVNEWISYFSNAKFILTNSFHGAVFSIIFNIEFAVIPCDQNQAGMNERIFSLLGRFNLMHKIIYESVELDNRLLDTTDWTFINEEITTWREEGISFIKKALNHNET